MLHSQSQRPNYLCHNFLPRKFPHFPVFQTKAYRTVSSLLHLCTKPQHLQQIHGRFILHGLHQSPTLSSKLMDCYASHGLLSFSQKIFNFTNNPDSILYNAILRNLCKFGEFEKTLLVYQEMVKKSMYPDEDSYHYVLRSCSCLSDIEHGTIIHGHVVKLGFDAFDLVGSTLAEMYNRSGDFVDEHEPVESMSMNDLKYWNSLISEASQSGNVEESFQIFGRMRKEKIQPSSVTLTNLLRSSVDLNSIKLGRAIHCLVIVSNMSKDLSVNTAVLSMYSKLGNLEDAKMLFEKMAEKDCVVWNIIISAYSQYGHPKESLQLLRSMGKSGVRPDLFTAIPTISSIAQLKHKEWGRQMHAHVMRNGSDYQVSVHNSLIDMYSGCNNLDSARKTFDMVIHKTVVSWSTMIKGYVTHDQFHDALSLFSEMKLAGTRVDFIIVINTLPACANIGALENVRYLHGYSLKLGLNALSSVNTSFLISYAKCGCIEMARRLFDEEKSSHKDIIAWNSMISAYAKHGDWSRCFELYNQMKQINVRPDQVTFLGLLTVCVNSGLVEEGKACFKEMIEIYGCQPSQQHHACLVDLLGRAGRIDEAREIVKTMPIKPDARVWGPLLSACKIHSDTNLAEFAAEKLITREPKNAGNYILLSNIYAAAGKWDGVAKMRSFLRDRGLKKTPGCSWLEINGNVHEFRVADQSHPRSEDIYTTLNKLELEIKDFIDSRSGKQT
ncbi:Pentatricopeptide repeat-containing protein [Quillaja saponaria]|uniref:Pentatricopeptide repeat-containing protein n=1 Tax=Quillaja saponaria TaxID=32244 RepID=A0AAD7PVJ7_QUISA|nr:Pentatricopeptide repeat-containing protein [Quillaja saponaria]